MLLVWCVLVGSRQIAPCAGSPAHSVSGSAVSCCMQVWLAVKALTFLGQHKTAKRLKYGEHRPGMQPCHSLLVAAVL